MKWNKVSENLPEPYEKVLTEFHLMSFDAPSSLDYYEKGENQTVKEFYSTLHFVAYMEEDFQWSLYYLYDSFKLDKKKMIPVRWMKIPK